MKLIIFDWLVGLSFFALLARLVTVGLIDHRYYQTLARENRIKVEKIPADRGLIYDRGHQPLARNGPEGREYLLGEAAASVLGYVGEGNNEIVGKDGLELVYDGRLKGKPGAILEETGADGRRLREISRSQPQAGESLVTSLDAGLQRKAYELLAGRKGAIVVSRADSGAILALVSSPGFKPDQVEKYLNDPDLPLFNRALGGVYPPGSTFKLVTAAAALEDKKIDESTQIEDNGTIKIGPFSYSNWYFTQYGRTEGQLNVVGAIKRSNDIFFYRLGEMLGIRSLAEWAKFFGLGSPTGIDLPGEAKGLMPDPDWKQKVAKDSWYLGDTLITAIGQGNILMTPLQVNQMTSIFASGGDWCRPHLVGEADCHQLDLAPQTVKLVTQGMSQVTQSGGTAFPFFDFPIKVAGKTGTAEYGDPQNKTHAWFTGFAPLENPQIVVTVLLEGAGEGSYQAAPVAKELISYWFAKK